jgi:hypothetical protein
MEFVLYVIVTNVKKQLKVEGNNISLLSVRCNRLRVTVRIGTDVRPCCGAGGEKYYVKEKVKREKIN